MENSWNIYARYYDALRLLPSYQAFQEDVVQNIVSSIKKMQNQNEVNVLDIGCGTGNIIEIFLNKTKYFNLKNLKVVGIDNSGEMLKIAKSKLSNKRCVNFIEGDIEMVVKTLYPASYHVVVMSNVLYNIKNPAELLYRIAELLCDDGTLIISDPKPDFRYSSVFLDSLRSWRFLLLFPRLAKSLWWIYTHNRQAIDGAQPHFYKPDEINDLINNANLQILKINETYAKQNFLITAVKK